MERTANYIVGKCKSSKKANPLKILMMQKFSLFKDFSCMIKRYRH